MTNPAHGFAHTPPVQAVAAATPLHATVGVNVNGVLASARGAGCRVQGAVAGVASGAPVAATRPTNTAPPAGLQHRQQQPQQPQPPHRPPHAEAAVQGAGYRPSQAEATVQGTVAAVGPGRVAIGAPVLSFVRH